ncbi:unnamed protein product [Protopolystoma xenopodis]|uniref:Large ribosomal subunit protein P2 n=1 Tax=Protopolystoma xenopodis TaxID=117903 RepID=A0A3S5ASU9_9PLAT|nr:unnamed protein product [Protopolystoma xenopodis]
MRYICAFMLAQLGGKENPTDSDIKNILGSVGIECDNSRLSKGKNVESLISEGTKMLSSFGGPGLVAAPAAATTVQAPASKAVDKPEEITKKAPKSESEESDDDMGMNLFD